MLMWYLKRCCMVKFSTKRDTLLRLNVKSNIKHCSQFMTRLKNWKKNPGFIVKWQSFLWGSIDYHKPKATSSRHFKSHKWRTKMNRTKLWGIHRLMKKFIQKAMRKFCLKRDRFISRKGHSVRLKQFSRSVWKFTSPIMKQTPIMSQKYTYKWEKYIKNNRTSKKQKICMAAAYKLWVRRKVKILWKWLRYCTGGQVSSLKERNGRMPTKMHWNRSR